MQQLIAQKQATTDFTNFTEIIFFGSCGICGFAFIFEETR